MQVLVENIGKLERKLTVSLPADGMQNQINARLRQLGREVRIKGFRPGKVPARVIEQRFGNQVRSEALGEVIRNALNSALVQENLRPARAPAVEATKVDLDGELSFTATFEVMPDVGTVDVSALKVVRPVAEVKDEDIDHMIDTLRLQRRSWNEVARAAAVGDMVMFESNAVTAEGRVPPEGVERSGTIIGSGALFPELEQKLVGLSVDQESSFDIVFPEAYRVAALAGREAKLTVKIVRVSEASLPEVNSDFIQSFGVSDGTVETFRAEVRANLERELKGALMGRLKAQVVEALIASHADLELPNGMVDAEARSLAQQASQPNAARGASAPVDATQYQEVAARRVKAAILLGELARQNSLRLDQNRLNETMAMIASTYEDPQEVIELYRRDPQLMQNLQSRVIEDQVIDWIADHADLSTQSLTFAEVMRPAGM